MQIIIVKGNLGRNAEVVNFDNGSRQQLGFSVACTEKKNGESVTTWYDVLYHNMRMQSYLLKGKEVVVTGKFSASTYVTKDGTSRTALRIFADSLELCGARDQSVNTESKLANPRSESINAPAGNGPMQGGVNQAQSLDGGDEGLPF